MILKRSNGMRILSAMQRLAGFAALCFCLPCSRSADKVLVLNSDSSVEKYFSAESAFTSAITAPSTVIDLGPDGKSDNAELQIASLNPSTIYCIGSKAYLLAMKVAKRKHIILSSAINWERFPLGKNTFVIANEVPARTQLTMFRYFFPSLKSIGVLYSKKFTAQWVDGATAHANEVALRVVSAPVARDKDVLPALNTLLDQVDALWLISDPVVLSNEQLIQNLFAACDKRHKPVFTYTSAFEGLEPTLKIEPDTSTIGRQAAAATENAASLTAAAVQPPVGTDVVLNLRKANACGLVVNNDAFDSVNRLIR